MKRFVYFVICDEICNKHIIILNNSNERFKTDTYFFMNSGMRDCTVECPWWCVMLSEAHRSNVVDRVSCGFSESAS